ncbi:hypothetical protein ABZS66_11080 [Dactylosporangium sp. NPDC005572]|uniref:hypothetical protein n=1 Tax=Dactylosporangium sp. NPDC005572 TaxID=3156889 RepID=UPI0033B7A981
MRWFRRKQADRPLMVDPVRQEALVADVRRRFGGHLPGRFQDQAGALAQFLNDDDGLAVANRIVHETAEQAHADLQAQAAARGYGVDRRNYRALYRQTGLQYRLDALPPGWHPYVHLPAALAAVEANAKRAMVLTDPNWLLIHTLELLDLTVSSWEFGRVPVSADAARLASRLIAAATRMRLTEDNPPALPPGIREVMRSNRTMNVHDGAGAVVGVINVGAQTRSSFLI